MNNEPLVSVIMPAFDRLAPLQSAVASVLAQTSPDFELLIADDGSAEPARGWLAQLAEPRIRVLSLPHSGVPSVARNAAIHVARGRYLAFIDSDDLWAPDKLERQLGMMRERGVAWSYTQCDRIDAAGQPASSVGVQPWRRIQGDIVEELLEVRALIATPTVIAERTLVEAAGAFDEQQLFCEDYDLWLRLALRSRAAAFDDKLATVRVHAGNFSSDRLGAHKGWVRLYGKMQELVPTAHLRRVCQRRRATARLSVAQLQWRLRHRGDTLRSMIAALRDGWSHAPWWPGAVRTAFAMLLKP